MATKTYSYGLPPNPPDLFKVQEGWYETQLSDCESGFWHVYIRNGLGLFKRSKAFELDQNPPINDPGSYSEFCSGLGKLTPVLVAVDEWEGELELE